MVDIIIKVLEPAPTYDLMSLEEVKNMLGITNGAEDAKLQLMISSYSDAIATLCNRVFAREKIRETWRCLQSNRVFLSHYPIAAEADIESVYCPRDSTTMASYEVELRSGKLELANQNEPIEVVYTGGYDLPDQTPPALKQALFLMIKEQRSQDQQAAVAGVKSLSHKESRVMFFDPNTGSSGGKAGAIGVVFSDTVKNLLMHYVRIQV